MAGPVLKSIFELVAIYYAQITGTLVALGISATGVYFGMRSYRLSRASAAKAPRLEAVMFGTNVARAIYFFLPFDGSTVYAVPIRLIVTNTGSKSARKVDVLMEMSDNIYLHELPRSADRIATARRIETVADQGRNQHIARVHYHLADIPPQVSLNVSDFIFAKDPSIHSRNVDATTKDGVPVRVGVKLATSMPISIAVTGEDLAPLKLTVDVAFRKGAAADFGAVVAAENALIAETARSSADFAEEDATFIGFGKFTTKIETPELTIRDADHSSTVAYNVRRTAEGLRPRKA